MEEGLKADQGRELSDADGEKWAAGIGAKTQGTQTCGIVEREDIVDLSIRLLLEHLLADGALHEDSAPAIGPAILNGTEQDLTILEAVSKRQEGGIDGKGFRPFPPLRRVLERNGRPSSGGVQPPYEASPSLPIEIGLPNSCTIAANAPGQAALVQAEREFVLGGGGQIGQPIMQLQHETSGGQCPQRNSGGTILQPPQRVMTYKKPARHVGGADAALAPSQGEIVAQFAQRADHGQGKGRCRRHEHNVRYNGHCVNKCPPYRSLQ